MGLRTKAGAAVFAALFLGSPAGAAPLRIATFAPDLSRDGPGLLLRDIGKGDAQVQAVAAVIAEARPDILLLTDVDWDHDGKALAALLQVLRAAGADFPHHFTARPNAGMATGLDLDGDGRLGSPDDAQGYGEFSGQGGLVLLSRHPIGPVIDHSGFLWRDLPGNRMPPLPQQAQAVRRLSSTSHWDAVVQVNGQPLHLLAMSASPPVFGRRAGLNRARNHDELAFWRQHLPQAPFVLLGNLNVDPQDGDGDRAALHDLMAQVTDPQPRSAGGTAAGASGLNAGQKGDPALDTGDWDDQTGPGNLRADYLLPRKGLTIRGAGVLWPSEGPLAQTVLAASRHRLVWVDLDWP